mgnify:CR=1 FL=1
MSRRNPPSAEPAAPDLAGYETLVAVCGGIAAYKTAAVVSALVQRGCGVTVAMTRAARRFVTPLTFEALSGRRVHTSLWDAADSADPQHLGLTESADLFLIAPTTANMLAKLAHGLADDLVSTMALAVTCPTLLAPAMNDRMWAHRAVQRNVATLKADGYVVIGPETGWMACRAVGMGRMSEPDEIVNLAAELLRRAKPRAGKRAT